MRITGGQARGRVIRSPASADVRPTASKTRQALFNILSDKVDSANFLEIFAGSGLIGLEALSRGAASLTAIEHNRKLASNIRDITHKMGYQANVLACDFRSGIKAIAGKKFDIVFADPPYKTDYAQIVLTQFDQSDLLETNAIIVIEHAKDTCLDQKLLSLEKCDFRKYGLSALSFYVRM